MSRVAAWQTIVAGMGGDAGAEALAVTVRRLATRREERLAERWRGVGKDVLVGLVVFVAGLVIWPPHANRGLAPSIGAGRRHGHPGSARCPEG